SQTELLGMFTQCWYQYLLRVLEETFDTMTYTCLFPFGGWAWEMLTCATCSHGELQIIFFIFTIGYCLLSFEFLSWPQKSYEIVLGWTVVLCVKLISF